MANEITLVLALDEAGYLLSPVCPLRFDSDQGWFVWPSDTGEIDLDVSDHAMLGLPELTMGKWRKFRLVPVEGGE